MKNFVIYVSLSPKSNMTSSESTVPPLAGVTVCLSLLLKSLPGSHVLYQGTLPLGTKPIRQGVASRTVHLHI